LGWRAGMFPFLPSPGVSEYQPALPVADTPTPTEAAADDQTTDQPQTETPLPNQEPPPIQTVQPGEIPGIIVLSLSEAGYFHLFAYHPENFPVTRLTYGDWHDIHPAVSPDGAKIAFSSNRSGVYDIYLLDVLTGQTTQVTDDPAYDGHPAWSSDGLWLAYEKYQNDNLDIYMQALSANSGEIRVTTHAAQDFAPAWRPESRLLAFTSARNHKLDILIADTENINADGNPAYYTQNVTADQHSPVWSPDGQTLSWTVSQAGYPSVYRSDYPAGALNAAPVTAGELHQWSPDGNFLLAVQNIDDQYFLAILNAEGQTYRLLPQGLTGQIDGISWGNSLFSANLPGEMSTASQATPQAPWRTDLVPSAGALYGRQNLIDIPSVEAPHAALNALAVEPFFALKDRAQAETGWDVLSDLENMFVLISESLPPGRENDWLFTGRAFALSPALIDYEYMAVTKEVYGTETSWRVYLKPLQQDGSMGQPLTTFPWDFDARFSGSSTAYEQGGQPYEEIPAGYWVDFTFLAAEYGWERQTALSNWQSYYQGARFNTFAITSGLTWEDAMLQVWPPEVFQKK
ncbi:MAG TPA: hypothetical protein VJ965_04400, partial [Anaerolineales bacterium]|nr:hypothetical protein [Anaerolineales bacterium]